MLIRRWRIFSVFKYNNLIKNLFFISRYAKVNRKHIIHVPKNITIEEAAGIPEVWLTAFLNLRILGKINKNQNVMIYAGASGVGTAAIQIAKFYEADTFFTCSTQDKIDFCLKSENRFI